MQQSGVRCERHQRLVHLVRLERGAALLAVLAAHRHPDVGVDHVGALNSFRGVGKLTHIGRIAETVAFGACDGEFGADESAGFGERARYIVALADKRELRAFEPPEHLLDREEVGERLQRMITP